MKLHMKLQMSIKNCRSRHSIYTPTCSHLQPCPRRIYPEKNDPFRSQESPCAPQRIICDISMKMICDAHTCGDCRYLERDEQDDRTANLAEFLANCQHAKCKVVRLVRQQISKLQNMQVRVPAFPVIGPIDPPNTFPTSLKLPSGSFGELSLSLHFKIHSRHIRLWTRDVDFALVRDNSERFCNLRRDIRKGGSASKEIKHIFVKKLNIQKIKYIARLKISFSITKKNFFI